MNIVVQGRSWLVPHPGAVLASGARFLLGCGRCASICNSADRCACCARYKTRSAGGSAAYYPADDNGHRQLMTLVQFRSILEREVA